MRLFRTRSGARALAAPHLLALAVGACTPPRGAAALSDANAAAAAALGSALGSALAAADANAAGAPAADANAAGAPDAGVPAADAPGAGVPAAGAPGTDAPAADAAAVAAGPVPTGESPLHRDTQAELLALLAPALAPPASPEAGERALEFLRRNVGPGSPARLNQGNAALARHAIDAAACRRGLEGLTLQTPEQRAVCGAENMVPIYRGGDAAGARACVDLFEFPNVACELPFVWASPTQAKAMCEAQGKRLCAQDEWVLACAGDPGGGPDRRYAYGDELDLAACNTNKPAASFGGPPCDAGTAADAFRTCRTNTEPAGAFPRCRSRFGAFDLHGNVAEIMTRRDDDGRAVSQLKGSAFFYADVARRPGEALPPRRRRETYPDHCAHDPRWHVEPMDRAWHVNYHLGFRCCKTVGPPPEARAASPRGRPSRGAVRGGGGRAKARGGA
ncbi:MAG TPA: SUMF1/EgtB/PvdO family nonheme iron enzyme [Polyangiaceae bacterium]|nr:SUMF1/EgtB/PvdO family nonheme iron enzyme [Polyangiaceae bacterium]